MSYYNCSSYWMSVVVRLEFSSFHSSIICCFFFLLTILDISSSIGNRMNEKLNICCKEKIRAEDEKNVSHWLSIQPLAYKKFFIRQRCVKLVSEMCRVVILKWKTISLIGREDDKKVLKIFYLSIKDVYYTSRPYFLVFQRRLKMHLRRRLKISKRVRKIDCHMGGFLTNPPHM